MIRKGAGEGGLVVSVASLEYDLRSKYNKNPARANIHSKRARVVASIRQQIFIHYVAKNSITMHRLA